MLTFSSLILFISVQGNIDLSLSVFSCILELDRWRLRHVRQQAAQSILVKLMP